MQASLYVGVSGQLAFERRLATIANNVANTGTVGYRAEGTYFASVVSATAPFQTAFTTQGASHVDLQSGGLMKTGNPLDFAIQGEGFVAIQTPQGIGYTRDGRMQILPGGDLVSVNGHPMLDDSGSPLSVNPAAGPVEISRDGMIRQDGKAVGTIGLFAVDLAKGYKRYENSAFFPTAEPQPVDDVTRNGIAQGYVEESNVNPILEMTRLIAVQRAFEAVSSAMDQRDSSLRDTIQALGGRGS